MDFDKGTFQNRAERFSKARRALLNATQAYQLGAKGLAAGVAALLLLCGWLPNVFINLGLFLALAIFLISLTTVLGVRWSRFRSTLAEAFAMEELAGGLDSRLISAWDFLGQKLLSPLTTAVIGRAAADLDFAFESRLDRTERDERRRRFAVLLILFIVLGLTPWFSFARVLHNFTDSWFAVRERLFPTLYELEPGPGEHIYRLGDTLDVGIRFVSRGYRAVTLVDAQGEAVTRRPLAVNATGRAKLTYQADAIETHRLHFEFGGRQSESMSLIFTTLPALENMQTEIVYPPYTRLMPRDLEGLQDRFIGLPRTRISLGFQFSKELAAATLTWDDGEDIPLETMGRFARVRLVHNAARRAKLQVEDLHGLALEYPFEMTFVLQADEKPRVFLPRFLKQDMPFTAQSLKLFTFGVRMQDDFGVSRCVLKWGKATIDNPTNVTAKGEVERLISPPRVKVTQAFEKLFENLAVRPGDRISFRVEVHDNRAPQPQISFSPTASLFIHQEQLADLAIAGLSFGKGGVHRQRIQKSKRATTVKGPAGTRRIEKYQNPFEANLESATKAPRVGGAHAQAVKDYFRLMSTVTLEDDGK